MQTELVTLTTIDPQQPTTEYAGAEIGAAEYGARESHAEEDGVDWCAWWAEYAEMME